MTYDATLHLAMRMAALAEKEISTGGCSDLAALLEAGAVTLKRAAEYERLASRYVAIEPLLKIDDDCSPTCSRVIGHFAVTVPGYHPDVATVIDAYAAQEGKR